MTAAQKALYWREWGAASRALKALGRSASNEARHALQYRALGYNKSSVKLTNSEFDRVLAVFRAQSKPDDLNAQLLQEDQPELRRRDLINRCYKAVATFIHGDDTGHSQDLQQRYLDGTCHKIFGKYFRELDERELQKLSGVVDRRVRQLDRAAAKRRAEQETEPSPF